MACKLTYKNRTFEDIQSLTKFIKSELISNSGSASETNSEVLQSAYDSSNDFGIEIPELYNKEEEVLKKFDSCSI